MAADRVNAGLLLTVALLVMGAGNRLGGQPTDTASVRQRFDEVDRHAARLLRESRVPGAALAIVRGDRIMHVRGFGTDTRGQPITGQTSFVLGSMSKSFTALAVMQLVESKRIVLDAPVRLYLPAFRLAAPDSGASVTVRHLLLHTSGIPRDAGRGSGTPQSLDRHAAALRDVTPLHSPGVTHSYASPNYLVLGAIVEAVTDASFATFVERAIFEPMAMRNSFTQRARAVEHRFAGGNVYVLGFPVRSSVPEEPDRLPTAGLMSSAEDLSQFLMMQLQRGRFRGNVLLGEAFVSQMQRGGAPAEGFAYAFGWRDGIIAATRAVHHGGIVSDFRGKLMMLPDSGWGVVVLTNVSSAVPWPLTPVSHQLADDIAAYLAGRPLPSATSRHRAFFAVAAVVMLLMLAAQIRALRNAWRAASGTRPKVVSRPQWRANVLDAAFIVFVVLLPRFVGLTWTELLLGAPDVAWWLVALASLATATIGVRLRVGR